MTSISSSAWSLVDEMKRYNEQLNRMVKECRKTKKQQRQQDRQPYGPSPWALGFLIAHHVQASGNIKRQNKQAGEVIE